MKNLKGGERLQAKLMEIAEKFQGSVKVGWMSGGPYSDGTPVAAVAAWNEYGVPELNIPPRPFIRNMISEKDEEWANRLEGAAKYYNYDGEKVLKSMGLSILEDMQQAILDFKDPRNADSTIAKKGFDKPLIHTGHMKDSITYLVDV